MEYHISILDQSPIFAQETATDAFQHTIQLAKRAEDLGYKRFWVSEHHNMNKIAGSVPEILISYILAHTDKISVGSGGVMLQHYSAYKVAETFSCLSSLAPGRVDLGVGKAPGGLDLAKKALQFGRISETVNFDDSFELLYHFINDSLPENHPLVNAKVRPIPSILPQMFLLGGSAESAETAAKLGVHFVFAYFLNNKQAELKKAIATFREIHPNGTFIVALSVFASEDENEAECLAKEYKIYQINFASGRTLKVQSYDQIIALEKEVDEPYDVIEKEITILAGTSEMIKQELDYFYEAYGIDEFMYHTPILHQEKRLQSFELLSPIGLSQLE